MPAGECIRATALGASEYSACSSQAIPATSTKPGELLPRRNLQVVQPPYRDRRGGRRRAHGDCAQIDPRPFQVVRPDRGRRRRGRAGACAGTGAPSYERISAISPKGIIGTGSQNTIAEHRKPIYIMLDGDVAQTLGAILREELHGRERNPGHRRRDADATSTTSISASIRMPSYTVPVTIKSLVFSERSARRTSLAAAHPSSRRRSCSRGDGHGHDQRITNTVIITAMATTTATITRTNTKSAVQAELSPEEGA